MKLAFIGLGRMGSPMARHLLRAGNEVTVYNRSRDKAEELAGEGARIAVSPAEAASGVEAAITMLADDSAVDQIVFGEDGLESGLPAGAVHISSSTISTAMARRLAAAHAARGQAYLSAPVFGRPEAAEAKKLVVVPAGPDDIVARCRPVFDAIGRLTVVAGPEPWQANALKLCGNVMLAGMIGTFAETFAVLRKAGVEPKTFLEAVNALFASPVYANYGALMAEERFHPAGFALRLGLKDVRLALETGFECGAPMPVAGTVRDQFLAAVSAGLGDADWSAVARVAARNAGL